MSHKARASWVRSPGHGEIRDRPLPEPGDGEVLVRALWPGVSRGTESPVFRGQVPRNQWDVMRAPLQDGDSPGPVKYGYLSVGVVEVGPADLVGRTVFCLYPHQTRHVVPAAAVTVVPDTVSAERAILAGTVETAVNAPWDAPPLVGDQTAVVGGGMVGCSRWRHCSPGFPACGCSWWTPAPPGPVPPPRSTSSSPPRTTHAATATWSCTPAPPSRASSAPWNSYVPRARWSP
jgi:hypothetical protein